MIDEIHHQSDNSHRSHEGEEHSGPLLVVRQRIKPNIQHRYNANECQNKYHPFLHLCGVIESLYEGNSYKLFKTVKKGH